MCALALGHDNPPLRAKDVVQPMPRALLQQSGLHAGREGCRPLQAGGGIGTARDPGQVSPNGRADGGGSCKDHFGAICTTSSGKYEESLIILAFTTTS